MTAATLGETPGPRRSAPVASIDHSALRANAAALLAAAGGGETVADLRHDAWGHGERLVARTLFGVGVDAVIVKQSSLPGGRDGADAARYRAEPDAGADAGATLDAAALYGLPGSGGRPVMHLRGFVLSVKELRAGEGVSYGYLHRAPADTRIALVTGGYAQGIVRSLGGAVDVLVAGARRPLIGRVAMDVCVVDIGDASVERGDHVEFFGDPDSGHPSLAPWTAATGLTAAEIVTAVGTRSQREHTS
ncbi:alanine racemase C-terminal domain-containing protein [Microbacterium terricola]|uniref:Alanine racemase C-terminal domain-containing protein n=1 Tax=Microbacterium terricola TaxID=344163 RepID=A0ABM8DYD2_9MICO|nr:alanine racemase C-terminal domain-containing protein [Microbacterium terricola]UYK38656.1 alanine racemase [Microbacterium terricola]BDV30657.1 hypothetical protein Microterr_13170 [Microbacterium terricola]